MKSKEPVINKKVVVINRNLLWDGTAAGVLTVYKYFQRQKQKNNYNELRAFHMGVTWGPAC